MFAFSSHKALEQQSLDAFTTPVSLSLPDTQTGAISHGLIFASPHSGRIYPPAFTRRTRLPLASLRLNEDALMDELIAPLAPAGFPLIQAHFPRCFVDVNRAPDELLPEWTESDTKTTTHAQAGLGVIPTVIAEHLPIYKTPLPKEVIEPRLNQLYHPYHNALEDLMNSVREHAGLVLLLDCHSMPGVSASGRPRQDIVLGDRFGTSTHPDFMRLTEKVFKGAGYGVTRNYPYAGGYVTSKYGQPHNGAHVIQIEVNRQLYMNPATFKRKDGFEHLQDCFLNLAETLRPFTAQDMSRAAE